MDPHLPHKTSNQLAAYMIALLTQLYRQLSRTHAGELCMPEVNASHDFLFQENSSFIRLLGLVVQCGAGDVQKLTLPAYRKVMVLLHQA